MHAAPADGQGVGGWEGAHAEQAGGHGDVGLLGQLAQFGLGAGHGDALPGDDHRPLGLVEQLGRAPDHVGVGGQFVGPIAGQIDAGRVGELHRRLLHAFADVDQHRTGATRPGDVERLFQRVGQVADVRDEIVVLGHGHADGADVGLLEAIAAE